MREFEYIGHTGIGVRFNNGAGYLLDATPLRSFAAEYNSLNNRLSGFAPRLLQDVPVTVSVYGGTEAEAAELTDRLIELFNADILANKAGKLKINGYSMPCFIYGVESQAKLRKAKILNCKVVTDSWIWSREVRTIQFTNTVQLDLGVNSPDVPALAAAACPHGFSFGYANPAIKRTVENPCSKDSKFRLTIFGAASAPAITIGGSIHAVSTTVAAGEKLVIDSQKEEIKLIAANGAETNKFADRNREHDVFKDIPAGVSAITWDDSTVSKFNLTIIDERRLPPWNS